MKQNSIELRPDTRIAVVGRGALGTALLNLAGTWAADRQAEVVSWSPSNEPKVSFKEFLKTAFPSQSDRPTHIWIAIPDSEISGFAFEHRNELEGAVCTHFSGAMGTINNPKIYSAHPIYSFASKSPGITFKKAESVKSNDSRESQVIHQWSEIPFCLSPNSPALETLIPPLKDNLTIIIEAQDRLRYHASLSLAVAMQTLAWQQAYQTLQTVSKSKFTGRHLAPLIRSVSQNLNIHTLNEKPIDALTGPLQRRDWSTVDRHLLALQHSEAHLSHSLYLLLKAHFEDRSPNPLTQREAPDV